MTIERKTLTAIEVRNSEEQPVTAILPEPLKYSDSEIIRLRELSNWNDNCGFREVWSNLDECMRKDLDNYVESAYFDVLWNQLCTLSNITLDKRPSGIVALEEVQESFRRSMHIETDSGTIRHEIVKYAPQDCRRDISSWSIIAKSTIHINRLYVGIYGPGERTNYIEATVVSEHSRILETIVFHEDLLLNFVNRWFIIFASLRKKNVL
jgi:hypothetical protein